MIGAGRELPCVHIFLMELKRMKTQRTEVARTLERVEEDFIGLWRSMSSLWGISPTMAEIHGLLFISGAALSMDDIMSRLRICAATSA